jgi:tetratricopeptide (TPR) repeat protein/O-antigen ligase
MKNLGREAFPELKFSDFFLVWSATLIWLPLTVFYRFFEGIPAFANYQLEGRISSFVVGGGLLAAWLLSKWLLQDRVKQTKLDIRLILLVVLILVKIPFSRDPILSVDFSIMTFSYLIAISFFLDLHQSVILRKAFINAILITTLISLIYIGITIGYWLDIFQVSYLELASPGYIAGIVPRLSLTRDPNLLAVNLLLVIPFGMFRFYSSNSRGWKLAYGLMIASLTIVLLLTKSRGGLIGFGLMAAGYILAEWKTAGGFFLKDRKAKVIGGLLVLLLLAGGLNIVVNRGIPKMIVGQRVYIWNATLKMIRDHPLIGIGLGTFGANYIDYRSHLAREFLQPHSHNGIMNLVSYFGLIGAIIVISVLIDSLKGDVIRLFRGKLNSRGIRFACLMGLLGFWGHGLVDSFFNTPGVLYFVMFLFAGLLHSTSRSSPSRAREFGLLIAGILLVGSLRGYQIYQQIPYEKSREAALSGNQQKALEHIKTSINRNPNHSFYTYILGDLEAEKAYLENKNISGAISTLEQAAEGYPGWAPIYGDLAILHRVNGSPGPAINNLDRALDYHPREAEYHCLRGEIFEGLSDQPGAVNEYGKCLAEQPGSLQSAYWEHTGPRSEMKEEIIRTAEIEILDQDEDQSRWKLASLYFHSRQMEKFHNHLESLADDRANQNGVWVWEAKEFYLQGDYQNSIRLVKKLIRKNPHSRSYWNLLAENYLATGDVEAAEASLKISLALGRSVKAHILLGQIDELNGDLEEAVLHYRLALVSLESNRDPKFATFVARSAPYPFRRMPGYPELFSREAYQQTLARLSNLLEDEECSAKEQIYLNILDNSPGLTLVRDKLSALSCDTRE